MQISRANTQSAVLNNYTCITNQPKVSSCFNRFLQKFKGDFHASKSKLSPKGCARLLCKGYGAIFVEQ
jgi:hypothetical protein